MNVLGQPTALNRSTVLPRRSEGLDRMMSLKIQAQNAFSRYAACAFSSTFCI